MTKTPQSTFPRTTLTSPLYKTKPSATLAINELSNKLIQQNKKVYKFGLGQSPFPVPKRMVEELKLHAQEKDYLPSGGLFKLREEIASYLNRSMKKWNDKFGVTKSINHENNEEKSFGPLNIMVGPGSKELFFAAQLVTDRALLLPRGSWVSYEPQSILLEKQSRWIDTTIEEGFKLTADLLQSFFNNLENESNTSEEHPNTSSFLLILNYPNNPTGATYSPQELEDLSHVLRKYDVIVISDEIYGEVHHTGDHCSLAKYYPEGTIISSGISKGWGAGGWRLGFFAFPDSLQWMQKAMEVVASETFSAVAAPIQHASVKAFNDHDTNEELLSYMQQSRSILKAIAKFGYEQLISSGAKVVPPQGGFYLMANLEPTKRFQQYISTLEPNTETSFTSYILQETGVAVLPMTAFGVKVNPFAIRLAYVDFDGTKFHEALTEQLKNDPNYEIDESFLRKHASKTIEGLEVLSKWLSSTD